MHTTKGRFGSPVPSLNRRLNIGRSRHIHCQKITIIYTVRISVIVLCRNRPATLGGVGAILSMGPPEGDAVKVSFRCELQYLADPQLCSTLWKPRLRAFSCLSLIPTSTIDVMACLCLVRRLVYVECLGRSAQGDRALFDRNHHLSFNNGGPVSRL